MLPIAGVIRKRYESRFMSRSGKRKKLSSKKTGDPVEASRPRSGSESAENTPRSTLKDVALGIAARFLIFILMEGALRSVGWPSVDTGDDPYVGFSRIQPLFQVHDGVASTVPAKVRYFNEVSFQFQKPANTFRIFCLGGSTTYGHPFDGRTSYSRWLQDLLNALHPETTFEVINAGGISYASYRIVPLIREAFKYQPDLVILSDWHNEFLERRTYAGLFSQGTWVVTARSFLDKLHVYQALKRVIEPLVPAGMIDEGGKAVKPGSKRDAGNRSSRSATPAGKPILKDEVTAILDRSAGLDRYHRNEEFTRGVIQHFAHDLATMIRMCKNARVPVMIVDPVSNLKDFSPFKSEHRKDLTAQEKSVLDRKIEQAANLVRQGNHEEALAGLDAAIREDPLYAATYYWRGKAMLGMGNDADARNDFVKARDLDICPLRCITQLEEKVVKVSEREQVPLIRFQQALVSRIKTKGDTSGILGNEIFLDHVHPTVEGHQLLAEMIVGEMIGAKLLHPTHQLTRNEMDAIYQKGMKGLDARYYVTKDLNLVKVLRWAGKMDEAQQMLQRIKGKLSDNPEVHKMLGAFLLESGQYEEAVEEYKKAVHLSGDDPQLEFSLANAYYKAGLRSKSQEMFEKLLGDKQLMPEACANLAMIHLEAGKADRALAILEEALAKSPDAESLFSPYALALAISGNPSKAVPWMVKAVEAEPGDFSHLYNLAGMYALSGRPQDALRSLEEAVDKGYAKADKMVRDPVFASIRELPEFSKILSRIQ